MVLGGQAEINWVD